MSKKELLGHIVAMAHALQKGDDSVAPVLFDALLDTGLVGHLDDYFKRWKSVFKFKTCVFLERVLDTWFATTRPSDYGNETTVGRFDVTYYRRLARATWWDGAVSNEVVCIVFKNTDNMFEGDLIRWGRNGVNAMIPCLKKSLCGGDQQFDHSESFSWEELPQDEGECYHHHIWTSQDGWFSSLHYPNIDEILGDYNDPE